MTHVHAPVIRTNSEIAAKAREVHPLQVTGRVLLTTILFIFTSIGYLTGTSWFLTVFTFLWVANHVRWLGQATRYGYHKGARHQMVPNPPE